MGDRTWNLKEALDILVTVSEELNIIIPANNVGPAVYIDIPLDAISEVSFDNALILDSQQPIYGVIIRLNGGGTTNCILDATGHAERHVALAFSSQNDASMLRTLLMRTSSRTNGLAPHRRSVATEASERVLSDDELAGPGPALSDNRMLLKTAPQDHAIDFHGNAISTIDPSMLERVPPSERASPNHQQKSSDLVSEHEDRLILAHSVEMAAEGIDVSQIDIPQSDSLVEQAIDGIDVSQMDGSSHGNFSRQAVQHNVSGNRSFNVRFQDSQALDNGDQKSVDRSDQLRDIRPVRSLRLNTGLNTVENVGQLHARTSQKAASSTGPVQNRRGLELQDEGHDDLYYASPKFKKGHQKSLKTSAKESIPRNQERLLETTAQQASAGKVPPVKLSRQLRNAEGVVEAHTEQTADDGLTNLTKNGAVDVKATGNNRKNKASAPGKISKGTQKLTKNGKKTAQSRGKADANEETEGNSVGGDTEKIANTRLKATKAPRDSHKKARSAPTKASNAASSRGFASKSRDDSNSDARVSDPFQGSLPDRLNNKKVDDDDDAIWDIDQADDEEACETPRQSRQSAKTVKKQDNEQSRSLAQLHSKKAKVKKAAIAHNQKSLGRLAGAKPAPATLSGSRPRRVAAIKANKKIQGLEKSDDEIVDDDEPVSAPARSKIPSPSATRKRGRDQEAGNGGNERGASSAKSPTKKHSTKDFIPDSVSPDSSDKQNPDSTSDSKTNGSSDKVILGKDASAETLRAAAGDTRNDLQKEVPPSDVKTSAILLHLGQDEHSNQAGNVFEGRRTHDNVAQLHEHNIETETAHTSFQPDMDIPQGHNDLNPTSGPANQDHVLDVVPCADDEPLEPKAFPDKVEEKVARSQAPKASMNVTTQKIKNLQRLSEPAGHTPSKPTSTRRDPFASKLHASMPQAKDTDPQTKSSKVPGLIELKRKAPNTSISAEPERYSQEVEATTLETSRALSSGQAIHVKRTGKLVESSMQEDDKGKGLLTQSSKRAGVKTSTAMPETKRKTEEVEDTSNKRVKADPKERLEGVSAMRPGFNAGKTPPLVASKKPLVIGFSASGPRNQGTISTKKSKIPKQSKTGASDPVESGEHQISNAVIDQVEADFIPNQETLEPTSDEIQTSVKVPGTAQRRDRTSPSQKQHREIASAVAFGEVQIQDKGAAKRKLAQFVDDPAPWEHEQLSKRQNRDSRTPPTAQNHQPEKLPGLYSTLVYDRPMRLSSQNTRVNENGSPMPFVVNRDEGREADEQYSDHDDGEDALAEARLEEQTVLQDDEVVLAEPILPLVPLVSANSASDSKPKAYQSLTNNTKQVPSSPHAYSAFGSMPPHHLYHDGEIVNAETKEFIVRSEPQDPFLDPFLSASQKPPNAFMDALRRLTVSAAKIPTSAPNDLKNPSAVIMHQNADVGEDPDKTLVEPHSKKKRRQVQVSESSSNLQSGSSTQASQSSEPPEEESEPETVTRWRKGLEPHQDNMFECLLTISHVSNGLKIPLAVH